MLLFTGGENTVAGDIIRTTAALGDSGGHRLQEVRVERVANGSCSSTQAANLDSFASSGVDSVVRGMTNFLLALVDSLRKMVYFHRFKVRVHRSVLTSCRSLTRNGLFLNTAAVSMWSRCCACLASLLLWRQCNNTIRELVSRFIT